MRLIHSINKFNINNVKLISMNFLTWLADAGRGPSVTVEAVLMRGVGHVTLPEVPRITVQITGAGSQLTLAGLLVTEILRKAISIIITLAGVVNQVTDGSRVLAVEVTVMTS